MLITFFLHNIDNLLPLVDPLKQRHLSTILHEKLAFKMALYKMSRYQRKTIATNLKLITQTTVRSIIN